MNIMQMDAAHDLYRRAEKGEKLTGPEWKLLDEFEKDTVETEYERGKLRAQLNSVTSADT